MTDASDSGFSAALRPQVARTSNGEPVRHAPILPRFPNLRCLGGIPAADGRHVRENRFLRGPVPLALTSRESGILAALDPGLLIDFRHAKEAQAAPVSLPPALAARRVSLPIETGSHLRVTAGQPLTERAARDAMLATYRDFAKRHLDVFAAFLRLSAAADDRPVLFHCTAGKDRTGFAAALLLAGLGAPRVALLEDFLRSGALWSPDPALQARLPEVFHPAVFGVDPAYLEISLDTLDREQGGAEAVARTALGGETALQAWRDRHLQ